MAKQKKVEIDNITAKDICEELSKNYGKGYILYGGNSVNNIEAYPTGIVSFDYASGVGGIPKGRIVELFGPESSGKTTITFYAIREIQKQKGIAVYIDVEHAMEPSYMRSLGVDVSKLVIVKPEHGTQALQIATDLIKRKVNLIVIDSLAALVPEEEFSGDITDMQVGAQARLISKWLRMNVKACEINGTSVIFINQLRDKIGTFGYGNPTDTPGGRAIKFYASMRISIKHIGKIMSPSKDHIGNKVRIETVKNKVAVPSRRSEVSMYFGKGIDLEEDLINFGIRWGVLRQSGSWYSFITPEEEEVRLGNGITAASDYIRDNDLFDIINDEIQKKIKEIENVSIEQIRDKVKVEEAAKSKKKKKE